MPEAKKREPAVPAKLKAAVEHLFTQPKATLQSAAQSVGWTSYKLRQIMGRPHVMRWMWHEKRALLEAASAGNPAALVAIRDNSENDMARVNAAKTIELMLSAAAEKTSGAGAVRTPGLQIVIVQRDTGQIERTIGPAPMQIEGEAVRERHRSPLPKGVPDDEQLCG